MLRLITLMEIYGRASLDFLGHSEVVFVALLLSDSIIHYWIFLQLGTVTVYNFYPESSSGDSSSLFVEVLQDSQSSIKLHML